MENAKIQKFKCDILSNFQTMWDEWRWYFLFTISVNDCKNKRFVFLLLILIHNGVAPAYNLVLISKAIQKGECEKIHLVIAIFEFRTQKKWGIVMSPKLKKVPLCAWDHGTKIDFVIKWNCSLCHPNWNWKRCDARDFNAFFSAFFVDFPQNF